MDSIELINLLLIKSNYSVLYVERIFDLILIDFLNISEINAIPVTLNGLYLYLIEKILKNLHPEAEKSCQKPEPSVATLNPANNSPLIAIQLEIQKQNSSINLKDLLYALFGVVLIESRPFSKRNLFTKLTCRFLNLNYELFQLIFEYLKPVFFAKWTKNCFMSSNDSDFFILNHSSLVDWFTDIKFSTQKYYNNLGESHFVLAYYYYNKLTDCDKENEDTKKNLIWKKFKFHLVNSKNILRNSAKNDFLINYFYKLCEYDYESKMTLGTLDRKVLQCQRLLSMDNLLPSVDTKNEQLINNQNIENTLFDLVTRSDLHGLKKYLKNDFYRLVNMLCKLVDSFGQTVLLISVKLNNNDLVDYLLSFRLIDLDHCDSNGWTALRYSSWSG
jgi:hypothetical protein